jgi:hypothetical protein
MSTVKYPFGLADIKTLTATGAQAVTIENQLTIIDGAATQATGNRTLNLTVDKAVQAGATIILKLATAATQTLTPGTGITGNVITGVSGRTFTCQYVYDGTAFLEVGGANQIN